MKKFIVIIFTFFLLSCETSMKEVDRKVGDQPQEYKEGYAAGCNSGYVASGHPYYKFTKDIARYESDNLYKQGWEDGFRVCKGSYDAIHNY